MPRGPRIDYRGLLHYVIVRGIERKKIFSDKTDYENFLSRLEKLLENSIISKSGKREQMYDQRILGRKNFVEDILKKTEIGESKVARISIGEVIKRICRIYKVEPEKLISRKHQKGLYKLKAVIVNVGIDKLKMPGSALVRKLGLTRSSISRLNRLGEILVRGEEFRKAGLEKILEIG